MERGFKYYREAEEGGGGLLQEALRSCRVEIIACLIFIQNTQVPAASTTYWCQTVELPYETEGYIYKVK